MTDDPDALLETRGLIRRFGALTAVNDVDLRVHPGEIHAIIGPNGAGKTTLFNLLAGTLAPTAGRIYYQGEDITRWPEHKRARHGICRAFQITQLFPDQSVRENLRLAVQAQAQNFNPLAARNPDHTERADRMLERIEIDIDPTAPANTLSHGDQKKLEIGMGLAADPALLLLDEPTSGVSHTESKRLMAFLDDASHDRTILLIEHNVDLVLELSDRITVLNRGAVLAQGTPRDITNDERVQDAYMGGYS